MISEDRVLYTFDITAMGDLAQHLACCSTN